MEMSNQEVNNFITNYKESVSFKGVVVALPKLNQANKLLRQKGLTIDLPNFPRIVELNEKEKMILLRQTEVEKHIQETLKDVLQYRVQSIERELNYKNFDTQQILNWFTKTTDHKAANYVHFPGSFQTIGHIAHYNLTEEQQKWKVVIGQITLLKCPNIKTVVNKTEKLHNVYRTPTLEHMAGEANYEASLKERGVEFKINFEKVYWCSRLQQERDRLLEIMRPGEVLADLFCGVGPLAVRAAKKNLYVIANDLNPFCHEYLVKNSAINKVDAKLICWNMCAREAMRKIYSESDSLPIQFRFPDHIYMNLPVDAIEFLDVLVDYDKKLKTNKMPMVHVNCFVVADSDEKSKELLSVRIQKVLPMFKPQLITKMHHIKNVTVIMRMYCVSFILPISEPKEEKKIQQEAEQFTETIQGVKKQKV